MQGCLAELMAVPGAAELVMPAAILQSQQTPQHQQVVQGSSAEVISASSCSPQPPAAAVVGLSSAGEGVASAARQLLDDSWQQLPGQARQLLQLVLLAAADGTLLQALGSSALPKHQQQQDQQQDKQQQENVEQTPLLQKRAAPGSGLPEPDAATAVAAVPAVLWCWGLWCMLLLLVLAQVRTGQDRATWLAPAMAIRRCFHLSSYRCGRC
jgi:hypothetical protein